MSYIDDTKLGSGNEGKRPFLGAGDTTTGGARLTGAGSGYATALIARVAQAIASGAGSVLGGGYAWLGPQVQSRRPGQDIR